MHDKLIAMIDTIKTSAKVTDFDNNQQVMDLRDKLYLNNPELSGKVDAALKTKTDELIKSDLQATGAAVPSPSQAAGR